MLLLMCGSGHLQTKFLFTASLSCSKKKGVDMEANIKLRNKIGKKKQGEWQVGVNVRIPNVGQVARY